MEAIDLSLEILQKCGCRFPTNPFSIGIRISGNVIQAKAMIKKRNFSTLKPMAHVTYVKLMKLVEKLNVYFYMAADSRMALTIFRSLNWTLKYGYCALSAVALAHTAVIVTGILNNIQGGSRYGKHALNVIRMTNSQVEVARTMFPVFTVIFSWTEPIEDVLCPLVEAYDIGLQVGDTESAMWLIFLWVVLCFMIGSPLETMKADLFVYTKQMKDLK